MHNNLWYLYENLPTLRRIDFFLPGQLHSVLEGRAVCLSKQSTRKHLEMGEV